MGCFGWYHGWNGWTVGWLDGLKAAFVNDLLTEYMTYLYFLWAVQIFDDGLFCLAWSSVGSIIRASLRDRLAIKVHKLFDTSPSPLRSCRPQRFALPDRTSSLLSLALDLGRPRFEGL